MSSAEPEKVNRVSTENRKNPMQRILEIACTVLMAGIVVLLSIQIAVRHLGAGSIPWSGEMATWLFSWLIF